MLFRVEAWDCGGQLVENVQMWAARIFLGVGRCHPLVYTNTANYTLTYISILVEFHSSSLYL